ncbi:DUF535 family protein [Mesorhizobium sp. AR10]|uniref:DUF535 family protein n=1 Tax=Mesorhizobium sp. AR10 TaxID=2865839 RepID=UPI0039B6FC10
MWWERGAIDRRNGFFELPVEAGRRQGDEIPARKRAMYRRRYAMLDEIETQLCERVSGHTKAGGPHLR